MWILTIYDNTNNNNDSKNDQEPQQQIYRLVGASEYTIGRKGCMILLPQDDPSISRHHATLIISATPATQLNNPTAFFPKVHIIDFSKHGTIINGVSVPPLTKKESASSGSTIIFGRSVVGVIHYAPTICYISKTVHPHIAEQLKVQIGQACGFVTESEGDYSCAENERMIAPCWTQGELREAGVSPSGFLYVAEGLVPERGLMTALLERYCLVSPAYVPSLIRCVKDTPAIPTASLPPPSSAEAPRDEALERLPYRRPEPQIFDALEFSRSAALNPGATFRTLHFVFIEPDTYKLYHEAVKRGGGQVSYVTPYDVMNWYQRNNAAVANQSLASMSGNKNNNNNNISSLSSITVPPADSAFPLRYLLQDRDAHGTNTFLIASHRAFVATMDLIQQGIEEGAVTTQKANRTLVQLPPPSGTIADALALLYLKARLPLVRDTNIMYGLYSEDASSFVAGHAPETSPTNKSMHDPETMHFEFTDPSIAASALQVELEEASITGLLHAPKRNTNYLQTSASRERERRLKHASKRGKIASPSLMMRSALDGNTNNDDIGNSPDSSVSTVDNIRAYQPNNNNNQQQSPSTPTGSPLKSALAGSSTQNSPTSKQIRFDNMKHGSLDPSSGGDDGLNEDSSVGQGLRRANTNEGSFSSRQEVVCCQPERIFARPTLTPKRERDLILRQQQEQQDMADSAPPPTADRTKDTLYAKWQSFYDSSREGELVRAQQMYERKQQDGGSVGRRRAASPALANVAAASQQLLTSPTSNNGGGANVINVGRSYSPQAAARIHQSHRPIGSPKRNTPFAVSQSSLTRGGSPSMTHKKNVLGDVSIPSTAPFAAKALSSSGVSRSNSPSLMRLNSNSNNNNYGGGIVGSSSSTPRLLMSVTPSNVDHRLLQYCQELEMHSLPEVETEVLHANSQHSQGLVYGNLDLLKQRVMRYIVDIDLLMSESKRLGGNIGVMRASPARQQTRASSSNTRSGSQQQQQQQQQRAPSPLVRGAGGTPAKRSGSASRLVQNSPAALKSPVMRATTNDAHKLAFDCKSRLSVILTVLEAPEFQSRQQQNSSSLRNFNRPSSSVSSQQLRRQQSLPGANNNSNSNDVNADRSSKGYYNLENVDDDRERQELQRIEDALHSPRGSSRVAQERAASQAKAQRMMSHPRTSNSPSIPFNTSLLPKKVGY